MKKIIHKLRFENILEWVSTPKSLLKYELDIKQCNTAGFFYILLNFNFDNQLRRKIKIQYTYLRFFSLEMPKSLLGDYNLITPLYYLQ